MTPQSFVKGVVTRFRSDVPTDIAFRQRVILFGGIGGVLLILFLSLGFFSRSKPPKAETATLQEKPEVARFSGPGTSASREEVWARRLQDKAEEMQRENADLKKKLTFLTKEVEVTREFLKKGFSASPGEMTSEAPSPSSFPKKPPHKREALEPVRQTALPPQPHPQGPSPYGVPSQMPLGPVPGKGGEGFKNIAVLKAKRPPEKSAIVEGVVPAGSRVQGVMLSGLAVSTAVNSQNDPQPVIIRLREDFRLPRGFSAPLKDAVVIGKCHGDLSSERAFCLLETISYVEASGEIVESPIQGWVFGEDGRYGLRGKVVDRTGPLLRESFLAGLLSGMANFFSAQQSSGLNAIKSFADGHHEHGGGMKPSEMLKSGAASGVGNALDKLAQFAIDRAEKMSSVLLINPGRTVDIVLKGGFDLKHSLYRRARVMQATSPRQRFALEHAKAQQHHLVMREDLK